MTEVNRPPAPAVTGRRSAGLAALSATFVLSVGCAAEAPGTGESSARAPDPEARVEQRSDTRLGSYRLAVPDPPAERPPLLVMLHGCTQTAEEIAHATRLDERAASAGVVVLYPEQSPELHPARCWRWYEPAHQQRGEGEPARIAGLTRAALRETGADPDRVFVAGLSAGGAMALVLGAVYPDLYRAVGSFAGVPYGVAGSEAEALTVLANGPDSTALGARVREAGATGARPISVFVLHGGADRIVHPAHAAGIITQWSAANHRAGGTGGTSAEVLEAFDEAGEQGGRRFQRTVLADPACGTHLERWSVDGLGHAWSGGRAGAPFSDPRGPDATRELLRFLLDQPEPAPPC